MMLGHVNQIEGSGRHRLGGREHGLRLAEIGQHRSVVVWIGGMIQQLDSLGVSNLVHDLLDERQVSPLADIGLTHQDPRHGASMIQHKVLCWLR